MKSKKRNKDIPLVEDLNLTDVMDVVDRYADRSYNFGVRDTEERIIELLEDYWQKILGTEIPAVAAVREAIILIKIKEE